MRICVAVSLILLSHASLSHGEDLSAYPEKLNKAAADAEARAEHGQAEIETICRTGSGTFHTASFRALWSPMGLRAEGVYRETFVQKENGDILAPTDRSFLAIFNKFENALYIQRGPNGAMHRYGPDRPPLGLTWIRASVPPAWYRTLGRFKADIRLSEGELPGGRGRVTSRLLGESLIEFSYIHELGASRSSRAIYHLESGLLVDLHSDETPTQKNVWTQDAAGRFIPESIRVSQTHVPPEFLPKFLQSLPEACEGFEETYKFKSVDLDFEPRDALFEPEYVKLPLGTRVYVDKPGER